MIDHKIKKVLVYGLIIFTTILVGLFVAEFFNYQKLSKVTSSYVWPPNMEYVFMPNSSIFSGINDESLFSINNLGYRGDKIKDHSKEYRILITGGSTSECLYLDNEEAWPYLLMNNLEKTNEGKKIITINIAKSGHGIRNNILELKYLPENYEPDMIILMTGANDLLFKLSRKDEWRPFNENEFDNKDSYTFSVSPGYNWKSTVTYNLYRSLKPGKPQPQDAIGNTLEENRLKRQNSQNWIYEKPNLNKTLDDYEKNILRVAELSKERNSTIIFTTQPYIWKLNMTQEEDESLWMTYDFEGGYYPIETMVESIEAFNNRLLEVCEEESLHCIDLEKEIPKTLEYFYDDMHFNEKGADLVAEKLTSYIKQNIKEFQ